ncbi:MAG: alpha/beta fold hydrolase [Oscillatoriales cyanobacterium SM2_2_1]|nr:alpha/beta fold hydrolase [Oscillatoriales cyanobacterium SM2_2_1]
MMSPDSYQPPLLLKNGLAMTLYAALKASQRWQTTIALPEPPYYSCVFAGAGGVPIFGKMALPERARATIVATYGITGTLENQWYLSLLGRKAYAQGYGVVLFDWRAHGHTAVLSPTLTSDGLHEGEDFVRIAAQAQKLGFPAPFWFSGYSLGGQLALWAVAYGQNRELGLPLDPADVGGGFVICPNLDSERSLSYIVGHPLGRRLEQSVAKELGRLAAELSTYHPESFDPAAIARAKTIWGFDHELTIGQLGFATVSDYYTATNGLRLLPTLTKPVFLLYAADDPMFDPAIVSDLRRLAPQSPHLSLHVTDHGGHVGYISSEACQRTWGDPDQWWAWNRALDWLEPQG